MQENEKNSLTEGVILEALPNMTFRVQLAGGNEIIAYLGGKMRVNRIRVLVGDRVQLVLDLYGEKGRITKRL